MAQTEPPNVLLGGFPGGATQPTAAVRLAVLNTLLHLFVNASRCLYGKKRLIRGGSERSFSCVCVRLALGTGSAWASHAFAGLT